jgi:hypothetical protein
MGRDHVVKRKVWRKKNEPHITQFVYILVVAVVGVFEYFSGIPDDAKFVNVS